MTDIRIPSDRRILEACRLYDYATTLAATVPIYSKEAVAACCQRLREGGEPEGVAMADCLDKMWRYTNEPRPAPKAAT